jgi:serine/threonine protein kinase
MMMETLPSGTVLHGRYRIERVLGSGGFGHVYLAVDLQTNQQYAIKEYLVAGASGKAQLEHEARVLSHLHHPNLPAFQAAFDERGRYYVVLGYIEGSDLTDYLRVVRQRNEVVPLARIMTWIISICDAVTFLHRQNPAVIHRDIKPDNIRITPNGTAILVDLGNAKAAADGARTLFFIRHQGTPGYAPLEQYPGGSGTDTRSDVYALGGTLYFALTTHEPPSVSTRNQSIQQGLPDLPSLQEQLAQNPPETSAEPGSERQFRLGVTKPAKPAPRHSRHLAQLGTLPPELLENLNTIIKRAMAMKPKDRYQSVADLSNDLKMVLAAMPASTQPPSASRRQVDPHSTQPDLPLLYDALQNQSEVGTNLESQDVSDTAPISISQPSSPSTPRCPHCNGELLRQAAFCPHCGKPLADTPSSNATPPPPAADSTFSGTKNPAPGNNRVMPNTSAESRMVVTPPSPNSLPMPAQTPKQVPGVSPPAHNAARLLTTPAQDRVFSPAPQQVPPRPFIQSSAPSSVGISQVTDTPSASSNTQPTHTADSSRTRKILVLVVIVLVVIMLTAFILTLLTTQHHSSNYSSGQRYAFATQVCTYERNNSICITSTTPSTRARLRARRSGVPLTAGITERMVGPRVRHTPADRGDWLT